jgi:hypothetical protein
LTSIISFKAGKCPGCGTINLVINLLSLCFHYLNKNKEVGDRDKKWKRKEILAIWREK